MKYLLALLVTTTCYAQTATTQPQTVPTTAPSIPAGTTLCSVPKNGGPCRTSVAIPLPTVTVKIPGQTAPVNLGGFTGSLACAISSGGSFAVNPDGSITITGLACTVTK